MFLKRLVSTMQKSESWFLVTWFTFLIHYRKTLLGPFWIVIGPALFIVLLGHLFSGIGQIDPAIFVPYLAIGLITWTLISGFVIGSTTVFQRNRSQIMQGAMPMTDLVMVDVTTTVLQFLHQVIIIVAVFLIFGLDIGVYALVSLVGFVLLVANGIWLTVVFGIIGARYRDLAEIVQPIMRIAFLATPIIWMPGEFSRGGVLGIYLTLNPFYHFIELVRAPLLGNAIAPLSWLVVLSITALGFALAQLVYDRFARQVPLWV
jgi:ABC-type polysaccharide/polyol phosphate export permease